MQEAKRYTLLNKLEQSGDLKELIKGGFCSPWLVRDLEIFRFIDARVRTGSKKTEAVVEAEVSYDLCRRQVFRILKTMI